MLHEIERIKLHRRDFATKRAISVTGYMLGYHSQSKKRANKSSTRTTISGGLLEDGRLQHKCEHIGTARNLLASGKLWVICTSFD